MFDGWQWRYSREAEVAILQAVAVGNRIPLNDEPLILKDLLRVLPFYSET